MATTKKNIEMAEKIAELVGQKGGRAYYVGGCVRDYLLGRETVDIDIEIHGIEPNTLEELLDSLGERLTMGESFGIHSLKGYDLDIALPRRETAKGRGHRDFDVLVEPFLGVEKAALRRDFTMNAMMRDIKSGELVDCFGGKQDLENRLLRHVNDASFCEDSLRVLRGAQFAARFGLSVVPETLELCRKIDLSELAPERIEGELRKALLKAEKPSIFFETLREMSALSHWFPELEALIGVEQNPKYHAEGDAWTHTMLVLNEAAKLKEKVANPFGFMLSALVHDFGKAVCTKLINGQLHSYGHESYGLPIVKSFMNRITGNVRLTDYVLNMTELHMQPSAAAADLSSVKATNKMFDRAIEPLDLIYLAIADGRGALSEKRGDSPLDFLLERLETYKSTMAQPYVLGRDLLEAGLEPGEYFSELLALAHKLRLAGVEKSLALKQVLALARKMGRY